MGLFVYTQKGSIISMVVLPTTEIIEPSFIESFFSCSSILNVIKLGINVTDMEGICL